MLNAWTSGNKLCVIGSGEEYFRSLSTAFKNAKRSVQVQIYILALDETGKAFLNDLIEAARRGVSVQIVVDAFGSRAVTPELCKHYADQGVHIRIFRPFFWTKFIDFFFRRLHRKSIVVDDTTAFVGGLNISDDYRRDDLPTSRTDIAIQIMGPAAEIISLHMSALWEGLGKRWGEVFRLKKRLIRAGLDGRRISPATERVTYLLRDRWFPANAIESEYRRAISQAKKEIVIAQAYFYPTPGFIRSLRKASYRGVKVRLLLQGHSDVPFLKWGEWSLYQRLLKAGVEIYEYKRRYFHAKVAVVDSNWMTVGSSNLDPWSLHFNLEGNLVAENSPQCADLEGMLRRIMIRDSEKITLKDLKNRGILQRLAGYWASLFLGLVQ